MRQALAIVIVLGIAYFFLGWIAVVINLVEIYLYLFIAGIVGSAASVVGLLSFKKSALTRSDIQELEVEKLKSVAQVSDQLKELERQRVATKEELDGLEEKKRQMELLVRKASLALFLREKKDRLEKQITVKLRHPNGCDLKEKTDKERKLGRDQLISFTMSPWIASVIR